MRLPVQLTEITLLTSSSVANPQQRALRNLVHASGDAEEAALEISIWFDESEILEARSISQEFMLS